MVINHQKCANQWQKLLIINIWKITGCGTFKSCAVQHQYYCWYSYHYYYQERPSTYADCM